MKALLVEDNQHTLQAIEMLFHRQSWKIDSVITVEEGLEYLESFRYDIIILDLILPDANGLKLIKILRDRKNSIPILILSGQTDTAKKIQGLSLGADDYLTKPFSSEELFARCLAITRRNQGHSSDTIHIGLLTINFNTRTVTVNKNVLDLTKKEYEILELLIRRKGSLVTKEQFFDHLYGGIDEPDLKIIDVFICKLRKKLQNDTQEDFIKTVWGRGYIFKAS